MEGTNFTLKQVGSLVNIANYSFGDIKGKYFFGRDIGLTGCEGSLAYLPAGVALPFWHKHKQNEELYFVLKGSGTFAVDGELLPISEGSLIRVAPEGERCLQAGDEGMYYLCIQVKAGSLEQATLDDGSLVDKPLPF